MVPVGAWMSCPPKMLGRDVVRTPFEKVVSKPPKMLGRDEENARRSQQARSRSQIAPFGVEIADVTHQKLRGKRTPRTPRPKRSPKEKRSHTNRVAEGMG